MSASPKKISMKGDRWVALTLYLAIFTFNGAGIAARCVAALRSTRACRVSSLAVDILADTLHRALQVIGCGANAADIGTGQCIPHCLHPVLYLGTNVCRDFVTGISQCALGLVRQAIGAVAQFDLFLALAIFLRMHLCIAYHAVYLVFGQAAGGGNGDLLLAPCSFITGGDIENAIGINVEGYLNLRNTARCRRNSLEPEVTQALVVAGQFTLTLQRMDLNSRLAIFSRAKDLALARWNGRVALNQSGHYATQRLNTQGERGNVEQEHVFDIALKDTGLDSGTDCHYFVRVDALVWLFAENLAHEIGHRRHAGLSTDQHHFVDIRCPDSGILKRFYNRTARALDQISYQLL